MLCLAPLASPPVVHRPAGGMEHDHELTSLLLQPLLASSSPDEFADFLVTILSEAVGAAGASARADRLVAADADKVAMRRAVLASVEAVVRVCNGAAPALEHRPPVQLPDRRLAAAVSTEIWLAALERRGVATEAAACPTTWRERQHRLGCGNLGCLSPAGHGGHALLSFQQANQRRRIAKGGARLWAMAMRD